ncbi:MAG TPA: sugar ABC transporter permease [Candidatus Latescibacteria bacterium]|nr:sugar ABC transporter permease [Candidatus Handelsmanbacteria bacterium]HIL07597.1 sugar ABC transporter permease [Candidatus Latescibacterota bacterium]
MRSLVFRLQHRYAPYLFVAPFVVLFLVFTLYPLVKSIQLSFYITNGPKAQIFVGLDNFRFLYSDPAFHQALWNTCIYACGSVFLQLPLSLGLALLLNSSMVRGRDFFRFAFFSPHLVGQVFVAVLFSVIFIPKFGLLNRVLHSFFDVAIDTKWLGNPDLVMPALILTSLWMYVGFNMIYFLAALQGVDRSLYEAAQVDGAGPFKQFLHVTLPGIRGVAVFVAVLSTIGSFQLFELPYVMLNNTAGPDNSGLTVVMYLYQNGFVAGDLGYASAIGWTLTFAVLVISLVQMRLSGTWKTED